MYSMIVVEDHSVLGIRAITLTPKDEFGSRTVEVVTITSVTTIITDTTTIEEIPMGEDIREINKPLDGQGVFF